jgi:glutaminase
MSYIQIEIGGKPRGLKFNKMSQLLLEDKVQQGNLMSGIYALVYAGLRANDYVKGIESDYTFEEVCDWSDELTDETFLKIQEAFQSTEIYKKGRAYLADAEASKKKDSNPKATKSTKQSA